MKKGKAMNPTATILHTESRILTMMISVPTEKEKTVTGMAEYVTKEQVIDWFSPYVHLDEPIPFETLVSDLRGMTAADVEPVKRGRWLPQIVLGTRVWDCSECKTIGSPQWKRCPVCEAKMDLEVDHAKE